MEIWDLYDEKQCLTGKTHIRGQIIPDGFYHLVVHIWIRNSQGKYLITKRAENRNTYPSMFECVSGSVLQGETSEQGARREVLEEVGLNFKEKDGILVHSQVRKEYQGKPYNDILNVWLYDFDGEIDLKQATTDEVSEAKWVTTLEIKALETAGLLVPSLEYIYALDKKLKEKKEKQKKINKNKQKSKYNNDKNKYFDYYDDIKHSSHKVIDW